MPLLFIKVNMKAYFGLVSFHRVMNSFSPVVRKNGMNRPCESLFQGKTPLSDETVSIFQKVVT